MSFVKNVSGKELLEFSQTETILSYLGYESRPLNFQVLFVIGYVPQYLVITLSIPSVSLIFPRVTLDNSDYVFTLHI